LEKTGEKVRSPGVETPGRAARESPRGTPALSSVSVPIASLVAALKLPTGPWSASLLSFAKFFSLPLEGDFLASIRQKVLKAEALDHTTGRAPESGPAGENTAGIENTELRESLSLATLAASAKGVELSPEALAEYARALRGRRQKEASSDSDPESGADSGPEPETDGQDRRGNYRTGKGRKEAPDRAPKPALREKILAAQAPLLRLLNRLPGRGGERWIVLPFSTDDGFEACLRVLLRPCPGPETCRVERLSLDIRHRGKAGPKGPEGAKAETAGARTAGPGIAEPETAWSFMLRVGGMETTGAETAGASTVGSQGVQPPLLEVFHHPPPGPTEAEVLERELAVLLELPPDSVRVRDEPFPAFAEDSRDRTIPLLR
jgi:hypothetical protein